MESKSDEKGGESKADQAAEQSPAQQKSVSATKPAQRKYTARERRKYIKRRRYSYSRWTDPQVIVNGVLALAAMIGLLFITSNSASRPNPETPLPEPRTLQRKQLSRPQNLLTPTSALGLPLLALQVLLK